VLYFTGGKDELGAPLLIAYAIDFRLRHMDGVCFCAGISHG
jgi:hypothetical protein